MNLLMMQVTIDSLLDWARYCNLSRQKLFSDAYLFDNCMLHHCGCGCWLRGVTLTAVAFAGVSKMSWILEMVCLKFYYSCSNVKLNVVHNRVSCPFYGVECWPTS